MNLACNSSLPYDGDKSNSRTRKELGHQVSLHAGISCPFCHQFEEHWHSRQSQSNSRSGSFGGNLEISHERHTQTWSPTCHTHRVWSNRTVMNMHGVNGNSAARLSTACAPIFSCVTPVIGGARRRAEPVDQPIIGTWKFGKRARRGIDVAETRNIPSLGSPCAPAITSGWFFSEVKAGAPSFSAGRQA